MKRLSSREIILISVFILIILFAVFWPILNKNTNINFKIKTFITEAAISRYYNLSKEERQSLYENDKLFCLVNEDCTNSGIGPCLSPINKYYKAKHINDYYSPPTKTFAISVNDNGVVCVENRIICENRHCIAIDSFNYKKSD